jgi:hypothetical protein
MISIWIKARKYFKCRQMKYNFNAFMDIILYHYNTAFSLKTVSMSDIMKNKWINQAVPNSCKIMSLLNDLKKHYKLLRKM